MLSYLHGFHAGNFADMHKHAALFLVLEHLRKKDKPFCVIDTHAGSGWYDLGSAQAAKTGEWQGGIGRLRGVDDAPPALAGFLARISGFDPVSAGIARPEDMDGQTGPFYPGSPFIIREMMRGDDQLTLMELHPREYDTLWGRVRRDRRIHLHKRDGYEGLVAMMPPAIRRGLVLMDPSYDVKQDYQNAANAIKRAHAKWPTGTFMLWYPILEAGFDAQLRADFATVKSDGGVLCAELAADNGGAKGRMRGTGLLVINPPWQFDADLDVIGRYLASRLTLPAAAQHRMHWLVPAA